MKLLPDDFQSHIKFANSSIFTILFSILPAIITFLLAPDWKIPAWVVFTISIPVIYIFLFLLSFYVYCMKNDFNSNIVRPISVEKGRNGEDIIISNSINVLGRFNKVDIYYKAKIAENYIASGIIEAITTEGYFQITLDSNTIQPSNIDIMRLLLEGNQAILRNVTIKPASI